MDFLEEKWINDGCRIEAPDYEIEDRERLKNALRALDRTLDDLNRKRGTKNMKFEWDMTEDDWKAMKNLQNDRDKDDALDWFGNCHVGGICCDFQHTLDPSAWYAYTNMFYAKENSGYGKLKDGTTYDLYCESPVIPLKCKTFESFKKKFEENFKEIIDKNDDLKCLVDMKVGWGIF